MSKTFFKLIFFLILFLGSILVQAESIKIGLKSFSKTTKAQIECKNGEYILYDYNKELFRIKPQEKFIVFYSQGTLKIEYNSKIFSIRSLLMKIEAQNSEFEIKSIVPDYKEKIFQDNLIAKINSGKISFINEVNLDKYVAGVVQAEAGNNWEMEFYKVQSVISRTYALSNKRRHEAEGFHLCNQVHCQVYHHKTENPEIIESAYLTSGFVITDSDINLVTTAFYSNCGGFTQNSEDVWLSPREYLVAVEDTFCLEMPHATWEKTIELASWKEYLKKEKVLVVDESFNTDLLIWLPVTRETNFMGKALKTKKIRSDWELRSSFFNVNVADNHVILNGKGFGHGVGLCQEGAMNMAKLGYKYDQILRFYYKEIHIINRQYLDFFRD